MKTVYFSPLKNQNNMHTMLYIRTYECICTNYYVELLCTMLLLLLLAVVVV